MKKFDLNIENVLEDWEIHHAIRELIANAIDESIITNTERIIIEKTLDGEWIIRDFGRGIDVSHFTQKENEEKTYHPNLIGRFGVGLKDALATFDRRDVHIVIDSKHGNFTLDTSKKTGFSEIETLHVIIEDPVDPRLIGTKITLSGCTDNDIEKAKSLFIDFSNKEIIDTTEYGSIIRNPKGENSSIFINGVKVSEEPDFLFSYNITNLTKQIKKQLNRERTNVGRSAYSNRVKDILVSSKSESVLEILMDEFNKDTSDLKVELTWNEVALHAIKHLNSSANYVFGTQTEHHQLSGDLRDIVYEGRKFIVIPQRLKEKISNELDSSGNEITTITTAIRQYNDGFTYTFIDPSELSKRRRIIFQLKGLVCNYLDADFYENRIMISKHLHLNESNRNTTGFYDVAKDIIVIKENQLESKEEFLGTLIHELVHAKTGFDDVTRDFETQLTMVIGRLSSDLFEEKQSFFRKILK